MKRIYEVEISTDKETATRTYMVNQANAADAARAGMRAYHRDGKNGNRLYGIARVIVVKELGSLDG